MGNEQHFSILNQGVEAWNRWRQESVDVKPNLHNGDLVKKDLRGADLRHAILMKAELCSASLCQADLRGANLIRADLRGADLSDADLQNANLSGANLYGVNFRKAKLNGAKIISASVVEANFEQADLTGCYVYGLSAWNLRLKGAKQSDLIITRPGEAMITVDSVEVAQFIYLLLNNERIRDVIATIGKKAVLILGRFTPDRKAVLDALRGEIRELRYLPILFDFDPVASQTRMETVSTLARLSRFVIADITDAKTILQELQAIVPTAPALPVQPILLSGQKESGMFDFFRMYPWVLPTEYYDNTDSLITKLKGCVIAPAEAKARSNMLRLGEIRGES
jgi:hypothetical protein